MSEWEEFYNLAQIWTECRRRTLHILFPSSYCATISNAKDNSHYFTGYTRAVHCGGSEDIHTQLATSCQFKSFHKTVVKCAALYHYGLYWMVNSIDGYAKEEKKKGTPTRIVKDTKRTVKHSLIATNTGKTEVASCGNTMIVGELMPSWTAKVFVQWSPSLLHYKLNRISAYPSRTASWFTGEWQPVNHSNLRPFSLS